MIPGKECRRLNKYIFPAVFDPADEGEVGFTVTFPDLPGCITEGDTLQEAMAMAMAREAMELWLWDTEQNAETIPTPSRPQDIGIPKGAFVMFVTAWMNDIRDDMAHKAVKKTLTIPKWLNDEAERNKVNFSQVLQVLQVALKERLGIIEPDHDDFLSAD